MSEAQRSTAVAAPRHLQVVGPTYAETSPTALAVPGWTARLSRREADVLRLLAEGQSTIEIGRTLFISPATVKCHVARLIAKVGVRDRVQLVIAAYRSGFVQVD
jgi:DNA-binding NarL/FixJ family response regulator